MRDAAKAEPDGYTLLATPQAPLVITQFLSANLPFDPSAFVPVSILTSGQIVLIVNPKLPVSNLQELVSYAQSNPGKINVASPGIGSSPHLTGEMFNASAGIRTNHVPYRGLGPAVTDLLAGHVDMMFDNLGNSLPHVRSGKLKVLGVAGESRIPELPDVPAISESYPGFLSTSWFAPDRFAPERNTVPHRECGGRESKRREVLWRHRKTLHDLRQHGGNMATARAKAP